MPRLRIYTKRFCPYCDRAKAILKGAGVEGYDEVAIDGQERDMRQQIMALTGGRWDVPQVFVDDRYVGDDDALAALMRSGELKRLLNAE